MAELDFHTGKLESTSRAIRPDRRREYRLLFAVVLVTSMPYAAAMIWKPVATAIVMLFLAYFQVLIAFATSTSTDTAHAIRFLLAGSNPIGMTGSSSLLFGAVDTIVDWREDRGERRRRPAQFWLLSVYKFFMTPIGVLLMVAEYLWDAIAMRRPGLVTIKWRELFSMADFHDLICPEKSNDIFYADLAFAKYRRDPWMYQWNRLRSMVFELQHYQLDAANHVGVPESNLFLQSEFAAYQTLKRLRLEEIESQIDQYHQSNDHWFPFPRTIADNLVSNARPIAHYLRMRQNLMGKLSKRHAFDLELSKLLNEESGRYRSWHILRILDDDESTPYQCSRYFDEKLMQDLEESHVIEHADREWKLTNTFRANFESLVNEHFVIATDDEVQKRSKAKVPELLRYACQNYIPRDHVAS